MDNAIKSMDESIIGLMQEENALTTQYNKLIASAKIPFVRAGMQSVPAASLSDRKRQNRKKTGMEGLQRLLYDSCG